jgi:hypothetical protein
MTTSVTAAAAAELDFAADRAFVNGVDVSAAGAARVTSSHGEMSEVTTLVGRNAAAPARAQRRERQDQRCEKSNRHRVILLHEWCDRQTVKSVVTIGLVLSAACSSVSGGDASYWDRSRDPGGRQFDGFQPRSDGAAGAGASTGSGGQTGADGGGAAGADGGGAAGSGGGEPCALVFRFTTVTFGGRFSPRNVGAVWVMNQEHRFVETLEVWAATRANHLVDWNEQTGANRVDAVSGATAAAHGPHESRWDCRDVNGNTVPSAQYTLRVEFTEDNSALFFNPQPKLFSVDFTATSRPLTQTLPDQPHFTNLTLMIE